MIFKKVQLLLHPMWWVFDENFSTEHCWNVACMNNFNDSLHHLHDTEGAFGEKRVIEFAEFDSNDNN